EIDSRSDLYSLGVVTYEMLAGEPPFTGSARVVVSRQLVDPPVPLTVRRPGLPGAVSDAVMRALEKVPEARWQSGARFRRALLGEPTPVTPAQGVVRRRWRPAAGLVAVLVLCAGIAGVLVGRGREAPARNPRLSMLVLPFDNLRDDGEVAWLRDGSVSMLALALSQWRDLTVVDQARVHDLLSQARVPSDEPIGLALARKLAREAGAGTLVLGDFAQSGDSLRLTARTYDVATGARLEVVEEASGAAADVRPLIDRLAARLLDLSGAPGENRLPLASVTTSSLEAYRAYLQGNDHLNHWELLPATAAFRRAVAIDSTFSLAYFKLGLARGWVVGAGDSVGRNAVLQASRFAGRLPERERAVIGAYRAMLDGDMARSQQLYDMLLTRDSTDADAWYGLGDAFFHDSIAGSTPEGMTRSLRAFRRALALDPQYALAYEHITSLLTNAAHREASYAQVGPDTFAPTLVNGRPALDSASRDASLRRARTDAVQTARAWVALQPLTARAHHALFEAYFASEDYPSASREVGELRRLLPAPGRDLAAYLEARVRFARGDTRLAADLVRSTTASLAGKTPELPDFGREFVSDVMSGANPLAYQGDLDGAADVIALGDAIRRATALPESESGIWNQDGVWEWSRLAQLYSAAGGPARDLHRVWTNLAQSARRGPRADQAALAGAGAAAAVGLLLSPDADARPVEELEALTGRPSAPAVRALAALARGDSAGARRALDDSGGRQILPKGAVYLGFAWNDSRPLEAEARFQLGDYRAALDLLTSFNEAGLHRRGFDSRWGLLGRIHLLRGLAYERLGDAGRASSEFKQVVTTLRSADEPLLAFVQQARAGLARLRGAAEGRG
ncbi:MAG TPA: hypothetical protein VF187_09210, partial [Gemmatimonadales bacterium]